MTGGRQMSGIFSISRFRMATDELLLYHPHWFFRLSLNCQYCRILFVIWSWIRYWIFGLVGNFWFLVRRDGLYRMTGGSIVFGGGEPLGQRLFCQKSYFSSPPLISPLHVRSLSYGKRIRKNVQELLPYISLWIIDIKDLNPDVYYRYTHGQMDLMWNNLMYLVQHAPMGRILYGSGFPVSGYNTNRDIQAIAGSNPM